MFPRRFSISSGHSVDLKILFSPQETGQYVEEIVLACDNGSTVTYSIKGMLLLFSSSYNVVFL